MEDEIITSAELEKFLNSEECELLVGKKYEKYKHKWWLEWAKKEKEISLTGKKSWNWCAFLFPSFWLLYRKMYCEFAILLGITVVQGVLFAFFYGEIAEFLIFGVPAGYSTWLGMARCHTLYLLIQGVIRIICGLYANAWYLRRCLKRAEDVDLYFDSLGGNKDSLRSSNDLINNKNKKSVLQRIGGTNIEGMFAYLIPAMVIFIALPIWAIPLILLGIAQPSGLSIMASLIFNSLVLAYVYFVLKRK